ncbi:hypothetical protein ACTOXX_33720 [Streptomyces rubiginosohelvolus]|uniref:hypothetical protein n=1 Tax=Streptomyces rubiginosohelvolus TaxID=67362 RepID=UPI003F924236
MQNGIRQALDVEHKHSTSSGRATDPDIAEALRQVVAHQIGPRRPGVIYQNTDGAFRVLNVTTDPSEARRILKRRAAQFAITIIDVLRDDAEPFAVGSVWTGSDRVLKAVA